MYLIKKIAWLVLELILFSILFIVLIGIQFYAMKLLGYNNAIWNADSLNETSNPFLLIPSFLPVLIAFTGASILAYCTIMKHPYPELGMIRQEAFKLFGRGLLISAALIVPGFFLLLISGQLKLLPPDINPSFFIGFFLFFFIQSTAEEVFTRAYLIPAFERKLGTWVAIIISASLFGILHIGNDNFTWIGFLNIMLGGLVMALLFIHYRNIWICAGFHTGWNFIQASFFDFNVSGVDVYSLIQFQDIGYANISGSDFGYEGSLISVLALVITLVIMHKRMIFTFQPLIWKEAISNELNENPSIDRLVENLENGDQDKSSTGSI